MATGGAAANGKPLMASVLSDAVGGCDNCSNGESETPSVIAENDFLSQRRERDIEWISDIMKSDPTKTKRRMIPEVPEKLRKIEFNAGCFDPLMVAIGPYHHCKPELKPSRNFKQVFTKKFIENSKWRHSPIDMYEKVRAVAGKAKKCYEETATADLSDDQFAKMMFLDGCFVLQSIYSVAYIDQCDINMKNEQCEMNMKNELCEMNMKNEQCEMNMKNHEIAFTRRDLLLLENQLPFGILEVLMDLDARFSSEVERMNIINKFISDIRSLPSEPKAESVLLCPGKHLHLLDLLWKHLVPDSDPHFAGENEQQQQGKEDRDPWCSFRSAKELNRVGIDFKRSRNNCFTNVKFRPSKFLFFKGKLELPPIPIDDMTKSLLLNLVAYEMSSNGPEKSSVTLYICFLDDLIDEPEDVQLLRKKGILLNCLGSDQKVADLLNQIADALVPNVYTYLDIKKKIKENIDFRPTTWVYEFYSTHFSNPWTSLAFLGTLLAILLTLVQTYYTVYPRDQSSNSNKKLFGH